MTGCAAPSSRHRSQPSSSLHDLDRAIEQMFLSGLIIPYKPGMSMWDWRPGAGLRLAKIKSKIN